MEKQIFRKKSMDRVNSPEQLNDYVRVTNPGIWMILAAVIVLLIGICIWGVFGHLDTKLGASGVCENGMLTCYIREEDISTVKTGMEVEANGETFYVSDINMTPMKVTSEMDPYVLQNSGLQTGEWVYRVFVDTDLADGIYAVHITTESVAPMSFIVN